MLILPTQFKRRTVPADTPRIVVYPELDLQVGVRRRVLMAFPQYPLAYVAIGPQMLVPGDLNTVDNIGAKPEDVGFGTRTYLWSPVLAGQMYEWNLLPEQWISVQVAAGIMDTLGVTIEYHWDGAGAPPQVPRQMVREASPELPPLPATSETD